MTAGTLPTSWLESWRADPAAVVLVDPSGVRVTAQMLEDWSAGVARRLAAAGVRGQDRRPALGRAVRRPRRRLRRAAAARRRRGAHQHRLHAAGAGAPRGRRSSRCSSCPTSQSASRPTASPSSVRGWRDPTRARCPSTARTRTTWRGSATRRGPPVARRARCSPTPTSLPERIAVVDAWEWTRDDVLVLALPLFHMHGLGVGINASLTAGAAAVVLPRFDVDAVLDARETYDGTLFFGVPTMYARLADSPRLAELGALPALRERVRAARPRALGGRASAVRRRGPGAVRHDRDGDAVHESRDGTTDSRVGRPTAARSRAAAGR